jgi:hypothetical protein
MIIVEKLAQMWNFFMFQCDSWVWFWSVNNNMIIIPKSLLLRLGFVHIDLMDVYIFLYFCTAWTKGCTDALLYQEGQKEFNLFPLPKFNAG